jgi:hypothetical protein
MRGFYDEHLHLNLIELTHQLDCSPETVSLDISEQPGGSINDHSDSFGKPVTQ